MSKQEMIETEAGHFIPKSLTENELWQTVREVFNDDKGQPMELTAGQFEIFEAVFKRKHPRLHIMCKTRYGKSMSVGLAVLLRASTHPESWVIVGGTKDDAKVIMEVVNKHIFDYPSIERAFSGSKSEAQSLRRHRNKSHVTFDVGDGLMGEVYITTPKNALGHGSPNVVLDEAAWVDNYEYSMIRRMLDDNPHDNFLCKIGNPFRRNHFLRSYVSPDFKKIVVDCYQALEEGRDTKENIEENKKEQNFSILHECKFPDPEAVSDDGYMQLFVEDDLTNAFERKVEPQGEPRLGVDIARGGRDKNVWALRYNNYAMVLRSTRSYDLMDVVGQTVEFIKDYNVKAKHVFVDDTGVGGGVTDRLRELEYEVSPVTLGGKPEKEFKDDMKNMRAQIYASKEGLQPWMKGGGSLEPHDGWTELLDIRYKKDSRGRTKLESKKEMRKREVSSPDFADALALTFAPVAVKDYDVPANTPMHDNQQELAGDPYMG